MYSVIPTKDFQKSLKRIRSSGTFKKQAEESLVEVINLLATAKKIPMEYKDHQLTGELKEYRECHIKRDLLLVYQIKEKGLALLLVDIGTHSYLGF
jgi:mRNA interferase YafQ